MIQVNDIRILPDHRHMVIDVSVREDERTEDIYIDEIVIDNQFTFSGTKDAYSNTPIFYHKEEYDNKHVSFIIDLCHNKFRPEHFHHSMFFNNKIHHDFFRKNLFFVYITVKGSLKDEGTCCGFNSIKMVTVVDLKDVYNKAIAFTKELNKCCEIPKEFISFILLLNAFDLNIKTGQYLNAIKIWKRLSSITTLGYSGPTKCNCHG